MAEENRRIRPVVEEVDVEPEVPPTEAVTPQTEDAPTPEPETVPVPVENSTETKDEGKSQKKGTNFKLILIITILTALVVGFVSGGVYVYFTGVRQAQTEFKVEATATPVPTVEPTPSPTSEPEEEVVDLSVYKVSILNGSGKIGEAGKASNVVEDVGFSVSNTGNAASFDFGATIIEVKADVPKSVVSKLKTALEGSYVAEVGDELAESSGYDIVITVGAESN